MRALITVLLATTRVLLATRRVLLVTTRVLLAATPVLLAATLAGSAFAAGDNACYVASGLVHADFALPRVAAAIEGKHLNIVVLGSASSTLPGQDGPAKAYPAHLQDALTRRLPGIAVKVITHTKARESAAEMGKTLEQMLVDDKPDLTIWQTGTVDAMLGVDPDDFRSALDEGLDTLQAGKSDIVFMNMQYSPRTDSMIALGSYLDAMRFVALQREVLLFDRLAVMKDWNEMGVFDLYTATKKTDTAERVHDCIGRLLAGLIVEGASLAQESNTGSGNTGAHNKDLH
ncbi:MAG TPA: SGNH/GDSL hydrolase family protein [Xanthobacteraceae bacterium]|jgi:hypothetical protein